MTVEMNLIARGLIVLLLVTAESNFIASEENILVLVSRRLSGDGRQYLNDDFPVCQEDNLTYLVSEDRCVKDQELFNDCGFAFIPSEGQPNLTTALVFVLPNGTKLEQLKIADRSTSPIDAAVSVIINSTHQLINGSLCQIASLEVYRGRNQITEISHDGFSLSEGGTVKINHSSLYYCTEEYVGELYRMNLSCPGEGIPESGCLFFKLIGLTNLTNAKFNSTVKASLNNNLNDSEQNISIDATTQSNITIQTVSIETTSPVMVLNSSNATTTPSEAGSNLLVIYVAVGATGGIVILFIIILILCGFVYRLTSNREPTCISATTPQQVQLQIQVHAPDYIPQEETLYNNILDSQFEAINQSEHTYAQDHDVEIAGQTHQSFIPVNQSHQRRMQYQTSVEASKSAIGPTSAAVAMRRTKSQEDDLDVVTFESFKPKLKEKRSISWSSAWETSTLATSRSVDRELSQVYDTVKPVAKVRDERSLGFNRLCHPGYSRQEPLPSFSDVPSTSMLYASLYADTCSEYGSAYDVPRKAALTYSVPDVKKKREKKQKNKKESYEAIMNPEEMLMFDDYKGHYDIPKCKYTADQKDTANNNASSFYDQPRISKINLGN